MDQLNLALVVASSVVIVVGLLSNALKRTPMQAPIVAVLVGILVGPHALGWLDVSTWGDENVIIQEAARLTLAIGLMGVALRLNKHSVRRLLRPVGALLTVGMVAMWLISSAIAAWLLGLPLWTALLLGAVITPTDPVVASSIVTGKFATERLPRRLRDALSFESGANDGLAYLFVMLPILVITEASMTSAWSQWIVDAFLIGVVGGAGIGLVAGYGAAKLLQFAERASLIEDPSVLSYTIALSVLTLGVGALVRADALISVFVAGLVFNLSMQEGEEHKEESIQEAIAKLFTLPMFVIFGIVAPVAEWFAAGWPVVVFAVMVLVLRRPVAVALVVPALRPLRTVRDGAYLAWFGPVGIAAIYYAALAREHVAEPIIWHAASAVVLASILAHGLTAAPLTRLYAGASADAPRPAEP